MNGLWQCVGQSQLTLHSKIPDLAELKGNPGRILLCMAIWKRAHKQIFWYHGHFRSEIYVQPFNQSVPKWFIMPIYLIILSELQSTSIW